MLRKWDNLPEFMKCDEVKEYYDILSKRKISLFIKRIFDIFAALILLAILLIPMIIIAIAIKIDSSGPVMYRQERVTSYGKHFRIHKFRTMVSNADLIGSTVTTKDDNRITKVGLKLRDSRLDEFPQLIDVLIGNMSFVGTRPEAVRYVDKYTPEMKATLLLPAGITSRASILFKDEASLLDSADDVDRVYVEEILPRKMQYNLSELKAFSIWRDLMTMMSTVSEVVIKEKNL